MPPTVCGGTAPGPRLLAVSRDLSKPVSKGLTPFSLTAGETANPRTTRFLGVMSAVGELNAANIGGDIQQAFSGPLIDQYGNFVFYEILIDSNEVKYLCDNKLYNIDGQVDFSKAGKKVDMPAGNTNQDGSGSFELKLAWRVMKACDPAKPTDPCDDMSRFFVEDAYIMDQGPTASRCNARSRSGWSACISPTRAIHRRNGFGRRSSKSTISRSTTSRIPICTPRSTIRTARSARSTSSRGRARRKSIRAFRSRCRARFPFRRTKSRSTPRPPPCSAASARCGSITS